MNKVREYIKALILRAKTTDYKALVKQTAKKPVFWVRFSAYAIPLAFLLYVLYFNYSPLGINKTYVIDLTINNQQSKNFYLEPSQSLSGNILNGVVFATYKPKAVLRDARIVLTLDGGNVETAPIEISSNYSKLKWDYSYLGDECTEFNGTSTKIEIKDTADQFENGPFSILVEWTPKNMESSSQQIVGHFNWEIVQNTNNIQFQVGRMNSKDGAFYSVKYPIDQDFFDNKHTALAIYNPRLIDGYIDLYIDEQYAGRTYFNSDTIYKDYNSNKNLSFGKSDHGGSNYFTGCIHNVKINNAVAVSVNKKFSLRTSGLDPITIPVISTASTTLNKITINVTQ
jgi:hypothetical protein